MKSDVTSKSGRGTHGLHSNQQSGALPDPVNERFGGVMPDLASRAHIDMIERVVWAALQEAARFREGRAHSYTRTPKSIRRLHAGFVTSNLI